MSSDVIQLSEPETESRAAIAVGLGFNCYEFQTTRAGERLDVLWSHPNFAQGGERPSGSGIPLLFPFGGRIRGTSYEYAGRQYTLEEGDGRGNAIHGFVLRRPWRVVEQSAARVVGEFHAAQDDPSLLERWPADFKITVAYELRQGALHTQVEIDNPDTQPLPFGLATHAYFRIPPTAGRGVKPESDDWLVQVPVHGEWELVELLPTGKKLANTAHAGLVTGVPFDECQFDNVFTDLEYSDGRCTTRLFHPTSGRAITQTFDDAFRHCVVYTPPHREAICMEPYTALPDAFQLEKAGVETGLRILAPGETFRTELVIDAE